MQVKGTQYKVQTINPKADTVDPWGTSSEEEQRKRIEDYFENFGKAPGGPGPADGEPYDLIGQYLLGMTADNSAMGTDAAFAERLDVPTLEEIVTGHPTATRQPRLIVQFYEKTKLSIEQLKESYASALTSGDIPPADKVMMTSRFDLMTRTIAKIEAQIKKAQDLDTKLSALWQQELDQGVDLDGDMKLADQIGIVQNKDGTTIYIDLMTKRPIPFIRDRKYAWPLISASSVDIRDKDYKDQTHPKGDEKGEYDVRFQLKDTALTTFDAYNIYKTPLGLQIPQYIAVQMENGKMKTAEDILGVERAIPLKYTVKDGMISQDTSDMKNARQMVVTRAEIRSVPSGMTTPDGIELNDQVLELYNGETLLMRAVFMGATLGLNPPPPSAVDTAQGFKYVSADAVGMATYGYGLAGPIEVDATEAVFHVQHKIAETDLKKILSDAGVERPTGGDPDSIRGQKAYDANMTPFEAANGTQYLDTFIANPNNGSELATDKATGLFVHGMRGNIKLDAAMNFAITSGANEYSKYIEETRSKDQPKIKFDDPLYWNFVDFGNDDVNNVGIFRQGNNGVRNASFAWMKSEANDTNYVYMQKMTFTNSDSQKYAERKRDPKTFFVSEKGKSYVDNPSDKDVGAANKAEEDAINKDLDGRPKPEEKAAGAAERTEKGREAAKEVLGRAANDYFKGGIYSDATDEDIVGTAIQGLVMEGMDQMLAQKEDEWRMALDKPIEFTPEEIENAVAEIDLQNVADAKQLNAFFDEVDKEKNSLQSEFEDFLNKGGKPKFAG